MRFLTGGVILPFKFESHCLGNKVDFSLNIDAKSLIFCSCKLGEVQIQCFIFLDIFNVSGCTHVTLPIHNSSLV